MTQKKPVSSNIKDKKATRSTTGRTTATRRRPAASRRSAKGFLGLPLRGRSRPLLAEISPERKLDLFGVTLALLGLLTLLSLVSTQRSAIPAWWIGVLQQAFGWGAAILPLILIVIGLWMVLRNLEPLPQLSIERLVGIGLLFFVVLALISLFAGEDLATSSDLNGGVVGAWMASTLTGLTGIVGAGIILTAGFLVGLALTLDVSIPEMFRWVRPLVEHIQTAWEQYQTERRQRKAETQSQVAIQDELPDGFSPLPGAEAWTDDGDDADQALPADTPSALVPTRIGVSPQAPAPWTLPKVDAILEPGLAPAEDGENDLHRARVIEETLNSFGAPAHVVETHRGPTITQFGVEPDFIENRNGRTRVRVSKIVALADDLALALAAQRIRIQAPVPGRGFVGIEVPNDQISRVALRDVIESDAFQKNRSPLRFALGKDVAGRSVCADLAAMPHLLIAGTTGSGKSVCVNAILSCLLINNTPDDLRLILVDPKRVELTGYNGIPHLLAPVVVDADRVLGALQWMMREMDTRYHKFAQLGVRNIVDYNAKLSALGQTKIPYLVIVIDELADLMMLAPDETERAITRLAQLARATGLHLIIATQRPSVDVLTGLIKANFPARIAFAVASGVDSRVILDQPGAERLLGRGDMLFQAPDAPAPARLQGVYVSDNEIQSLVSYWRQISAAIESGESPSAPNISDLPQGAPLKQIPIWEDMEPESNEDPLLKEATELVRKEGRASISMLQRRMRIGYTRAARMIDTLEEKGIVGPTQANNPVRQVLDYGQTAPPEDADLS